MGDPAVIVVGVAVSAEGLSHSLSNAHHGVVDYVASLCYVDFFSSMCFYDHSMSSHCSNSRSAVSSFPKEQENNRGGLRPTFKE